MRRGSRDSADTLRPLTSPPVGHSKFVFLSHSVHLLSFVKSRDVAAREAGSRKINFPRPGESHDPMSSSEEDEEDGDDAAEGAF